MLLTGGVEKNVYLPDQNIKARNPDGIGVQRVYPLLNMLKNPTNEDSYYWQSVPKGFFANTPGLTNPIPFPQPQQVPLKTPDQAILEQELFLKPKTGLKNPSNLLLLLLLGGVGYYAYKGGF
jgi:hypothetical protein